MNARRLSMLRCCAAMVLAPACAANVPYYQFTHNPPERTIRKVVLRPVVIPEIWKDDAPKLNDAIAARLRTADLGIVPFEETRSYWTEAFSAAGPLYDVRTGEPNKKAMRAVYTDYLDRLATAGAADAVVEPAVVARVAKLSSKSAFWDGIRMRIPDTYGGKWTGTADVLSLRITVMGVDGEQVLLNFGGLEFPHEFRSKGGKLDSELRDDLFRDREQVDRAVAIALHPFVPYAEFPSRPRLYVDVPD